MMAGIEKDDCSQLLHSLLQKITKHAVSFKPFVVDPLRVPSTIANSCYGVAFLKVIQILKRLRPVGQDAQ
jgi:hypothetical protein